MSEKRLENIVREFEKTGKSSINETVKFNGKVYTIQIESRAVKLNESFQINKASTISALPSGSPCGCCGGSGRS
ncbi:hypothetical protein AB6D33_24965 [Vibrio splendidus]